MIKRIIATLLTVIFLLTLFGCDEEIPDDVYRLVVYGEDITKDNVKYLGVREDGKVMIPLLAVLRALGAKVTLSEDKCVVEKDQYRAEWLIDGEKVRIDYPVEGCFETEPYVEFVGDEILVDLLAFSYITWSETVWNARASFDEAKHTIEINEIN